MKTAWMSDTNGLNSPRVHSVPYKNFPYNEFIKEERVNVALEREVNSLHNSTLDEITDGILFGRRRFSNKIL